MTINYNVTGNERKQLVDYIAGFLGSDKKYLGAPSFAYMVGCIEVSRNGSITFDDRADSKEIETLLEELEREGFHAEPAADSEDIAEGEEVSEESANAAQGETMGCGSPVATSAAGRSTDRADRRNLTVAIPLDKVNCGNLTSILDAKGGLIKKALGIDATPIEISGDRVSFPWFSEMPDADETAAYTHFISALCGMSASQKRVTAREKAVDNEKYAFRCFLLRLGFIGAEYKTERKILLRNLSGSSAFKSGRRSSETIQPEPPNAAARVKVQCDPALAEALADAALIEQINASFDAQ